MHVKVAQTKTRIKICRGWLSMTNLDDYTYEIEDCATHTRPLYLGYLVQRRDLLFVFRVSLGLGEELGEASNQIPLLVGLPFGRHRCGNRVCRLLSVLL